MIAQKNKKILFLHGFFASGQCVPALALKDAFKGRADVLTPDLSIHPKESLSLIKEICDKEHPAVLVGNSCGSFYAQMVASITGKPALLGNPHFKMTEFLKSRIGEHQFKSPRKDGNQKFVIDDALIEEFAELESMAHFEPLFLEHYNHSFHFPGGHTPTAEEVRIWYVPLVEKLLNDCD